MDADYSRVNAKSEPKGFTCTCTSSKDEYILVYKPVNGETRFTSGSVDRCVVDGGTRVRFTGQDKGGQIYRHTSNKKITDDFTLSGNGVLDKNGKKFTITIKGVDPFLQ